MDDQSTKESLAIQGAAPVRSTPIPKWPCFDDEFVQVATDVLRSGRVNYWTGQEGRLFEKEFADALRAKHAIAVANGTVALELALQALDIGPGDEVVVPSRTFLATASAVVMRGATPIFADVDRDSQTITAETIRLVLTPRTKAIITVHLAGWPCDMDPINALAREHGLKVIEDCAQAHGARYKTRPVGSLGDIAAFSFCQDKIITTGGEGGLVVTNSDTVWERAWSYKDHGKSWDAVYNRKHPTLFRWVHESFGTNWRLTEIQSAMGRLALKKLPGWIATRRQHAALWTNALSQFESIRIPHPPSHIFHSYYKYYAFLRPEYLRPGWNRDDILRAIEAEGAVCGSGSCSEIYLEKAFDGTRSRPEQRLPVARALGETSLMFLVDPALSNQDVLDMCRAATKVLRTAMYSGQRRVAA